MTWLANNWQILPGLLGDHLRISALPVLLGFLLAIPLGWLAWRFAVTRGLLLTLVGLLYTIPSLALFVILPPVLGISYLSEANVIIALTIYAVAIMARSVADALGSVESEVRQSATALGYAPWKRFWVVDFPLAGPVMLAGLRVVVVSTISLTTVGALVGVSSLGSLFTDGYQRRIVPEILVGVVLTFVLALVIDALLALLGRALMPWARASDAGRGRSAT